MAANPVGFIGQFHQGRDPGSKPRVRSGVAGTDTQDMDRCARPLTGQLRDLARAALDQQGIAVRRLRWMGQHD